MSEWPSALSGHLGAFKIQLISSPLKDILNFLQIKTDDFKQNKRQFLKLPLLLTHLYHKVNFHNTLRCIRLQDSQKHDEKIILNLLELQ